MTEWVPGPIFLYLDPEGWVEVANGDVAESDMGESGTIASIDSVYDGKNRPAAIRLYITNDRAQAERWRSVFAAGGVPDLHADPPITIDKYPGKVDPGLFE
jgi:hypothetical protein